MRIDLKPKPLKRFLMEKDIPVETWGTGTTKSFDHLTGLVKHKEVELEQLPDGRVCITSRKLKMNVYANIEGVWNHLYEGCRMFPDESFKFNVSPTSISEKLLFHESGEPLDSLIIVAVRALAEELNLRKIREDAMPEFIARGMHIAHPHPSCSYPGLYSAGPRYRLVCIFTHPALILPRYTEPSGEGKAYGLFGWRPVKGNKDPRQQTPLLKSANRRTPGE